MSWDGPTLVKLGDALAELYPMKEDSIRVVKGAGLSPGRMRFSDAAVVNWFNILDSAKNQSAAGMNGVFAIVRLALKEFPENELLKVVADLGSAPAQAEDRPIRVLVLAANPASTLRLRIDQEVRCIEEKIRASKHASSVQIISRWAARVDDLRQALLELQPDVVHFSGHGTKAHEIVLEHEDGRERVVDKKALARLFGVLKDRIRVAVLNACYSRGQAEAIAEHIDCTVGMNDRITDDAAVEFAAAFYQAIGFGRSVQTAFDLGVNALELKDIAGAGIPKLIAGKGVNASDVFLVSP